MTPNDKEPLIFYAVRATQLAAGSADFLKPWTDQPEDAREFWRKAQIELDTIRPNPNRP